VVPLFLLPARWGWSPLTTVSVYSGVMTVTYVVYGLIYWHLVRTRERQLLASEKDAERQAWAPDEGTAEEGEAEDGD
jgi:hypothetical protein